MINEQNLDLYEILELSPNASRDTTDRIFRGLKPKINDNAQLNFMDD